VKEVVQELEKRGVRYIHLLFSSLDGRIRSMVVPLRRLESAVERGVGFDGSSARFRRIEHSDLVLKPDLRTLTVFPWDPQQAGVVCDIWDPLTEQPFAADPRRVLSRAVRRLEEVVGEGARYVVSPEMEFYLFRRTADGRLERIDEGQYADIPPADQGLKVRLAIAEALERMGLRVSKTHHEVPPSKGEVNFAPADAITTADRVLLYKLCVRNVAAQHGLVATFMPKPFFGQYGTGMHTHLNVVDQKGQNLFAGEKDGLSDFALHFIAGLLHHARGITAVTNPTVNSYKRLVPGWEAPVYVCWARYNRSVLIRIPSASPEAMRLEYRAVDGSCNPYLAFTVLLWAGLDGVKRGLEPPPPVDEDVYHMTEAERKRRGIACLPADLREALDEMERDPLVREALGEEAYQLFLAIKRREWFEYSTYVHEWERERYLDV